jgi:hypothetical protein
MKTVSVKIKGISPLLMHRYPLLPIEALEKKSAEEQAELAAYRERKSGELYVPGTNVQRALVVAASYSKGKGRASLVKQTAAAVFVTPEILGLGIKEFEVDARPVVIPATKGRVMRYRPRLDDWQVCFEIAYDENLLDETQLRRIVDDCGSRVGLLDYRPQHMGPFGRFQVNEWRAQK